MIAFAESAAVIIYEKDWKYDNKSRSMWYTFNNCF